MRKVILLATIILLFFFSSLPVFSEQITPKPKGTDLWEMYNANGDVVGTLKRTEQGNFSFYDKGGRYVGLILQSGNWIPWNAKKRRTIITPQDANFYVDVLRVVEIVK